MEHSFRSKENRKSAPLVSRTASPATILLLARSATTGSCLMMDSVLETAEMARLTMETEPAKNALTQIVDSVSITSVRDVQFATLASLRLLRKPVLKTADLDSGEILYPVITVFLAMTPTVFSVTLTTIPATSARVDLWSTITVVSVPAPSAITKTTRVSAVLAMTGSALNVAPTIIKSALPAETDTSLTKRSAWEAALLELSEIGKITARNVPVPALTAVTSFTATDAKLLSPLMIEINVLITAEKDSSVSMESANLALTRTVRNVTLLIDTSALNVNLLTYYTIKSALRPAPSASSLKVASAAPARRTVLSAMMPAPARSATLDGYFRTPTVLTLAKMDGLPWMESARAVKMTNARDAAPIRRPASSALLPSCFPRAHVSPAAKSASSLTPLPAHVLTALVTASLVTMPKPATGVSLLKSETITSSAWINAQRDTSFTLLAMNADPALMLTVLPAMLTTRIFV
jgi:hypothetical protein